ncbi:MAG: hypothetical protein IK079_05785 [Desulfovibrio sp.]|nr:hypothetical protein [Desulfovibrio sp.]
MSLNTIMQIFSSFVEKPFATGGVPLCPISLKFRDIRQGKMAFDKMNPTLP